MKRTNSLNDFFRKMTTDEFCENILGALVICDVVLTLTACFHGNWLAAIGWCSAALANVKCIDFASRGRKGDSRFENRRK